MQPHARILLVEDDASTARFVQMVLEELPVQVLTCTNVPEALETLRAQPVRLIITDLMLPGESGMDLVQRLVGEPSLHAQAVPVVVLSAGLTPAVRAQLETTSVWRMLSKPASVVELEACVREALGLEECETPAPSPDQDHGPDPDLSAAEQQAIATHFFGDTALFRSYRSSCLAQFPKDVDQGDAACAAQDWPALRRLAHSLATVLLTLGHPAQSAHARRLEDAAALAHPLECTELWPPLRRFLQQQPSPM